MVAGQRLFQGFAVGGDFAFQIIGFGNFLLDARPVKRLPVFGDDFLLVAVGGHCQPADIGAPRAVAEVVQKIAETAFYMSPKAGELRLGENAFAFPQLRNRIAQRLQVFGSFPVVVVKAGKFVANVAVVVGIGIFAEVFLCLPVVGNGGAEIDIRMFVRINRSAVV